MQELRANQSSPILGGMYTTPEIRNGFALSDQQVLNYYSSAAPARSDSIPAQKTYSYDQLRHLGLNDQQILDYVRKQQQSAISSSGSVMSAPPPAGETYTYTEPTNQFGPTDEHVLEYSREQQQRATIASGFGNSSVMPSHPAAGNTYTYTELRNQLGLNDEQILEYTRKQQSAISSSDSSVVSAHPAAVKTYTYTELRNKLGLTDEQILDYYTAHYAAERLPQSVGSTNSSTSRVVSSPPLVDRTYTYSELRDGFGFSNDQILDYYSTLARAKQSALSSNTTANATATSSALYAPGRIPQLAGRTYTYSELKDEFGLTDAQIIDYFASAKRGSPGSSVSNISGDPSAVENNSRGNTFDALPSSASKAYTDSELRDVLGYTEGQIPDYYSQKDAELVAPSVSSPIVSAASSLQPASTTRAYTYSDLRNKFGFSDEQILIYYANLKTGSTGISGSSVEASAVDNTNYGTKPMGEDEAKKEPDGRSFTYSEMRDVFRMNDAQILNYYKEQDALGMALPVGEPASVEVNSSAVSGLDSTGMAIGSPVKTDADLDTSLALRLAGKTHTYSELRDKFGLSDAQILEYYSRSIAKHRAGSSISYHGEPIDIPRSVQQPVDRTYTYTELHDMLGMSENQILDYYSKIDGSKRSSLPSIGLAIGNPVS